MRVIDFNKDGAAVMDRIREVYGFSTKIEYANHLEVTSSNLAMRYKRDLFPADLVVRCMNETGAKLEWLAFGTGKILDDGKLDSLDFPLFKLIDGQLYESGEMMFDKSMFLPGTSAPKEPIVIVDENIHYVIEKQFADTYDGKWLINLEGKITIRDLIRIPVKKVRVIGPGTSFDCEISDITVIGRVINKIESL
ncbi:MAG: phage repressor protein CI [Rouxiella badensis]|uniref:phage repressor protein CI n=1 Tax=Rouxiella badensis TaxID=1646377 RepID=UPI003C47A435